MSLIWGSGVCIPARVGCQSAPSPYHPGPKGGGGGQGTAELSLERDANRQSWEKVNKGHAPCRRPAGAHPPLRPPPVHFHSPSASPPPDSRAALGVGGHVPDPSPSPRRQGCAPSTLTCKGCPPTLQKTKKLSNLCRASEPRSRACCPRVQRPRAPSSERGRRAEAVAPGRCLGPDRLHVSPAPGHVHQLSPVRRLDVLRINKMKLRTTGGQIAPGSPNPQPRTLGLPPHPSPAAAPPTGRSPRGKLQPPRAPALPRPLAGPGALCRSH